MQKLLYKSAQDVEIQEDSSLLSEGFINVNSSNGSLDNKGIISAEGKKGVHINSCGVNNKGAILTVKGSVGAYL